VPNLYFNPRSFAMRCTQHSGTDLLTMHLCMALLLLLLLPLQPARAQ
jgi:hypothetical protein